MYETTSLMGLERKGADLSSREISGTCKTKGNMTGRSTAVCLTKLFLTGIWVNNSETIINV